MSIPPKAPLPQNSMPPDGDEVKKAKEFFNTFLAWSVFTAIFIGLIVYYLVPDSNSDFQNQIQQQLKVEILRNETQINFLKSQLSAKPDALGRFEQFQIGVQETPVSIRIMPLVEYKGDWNLIEFQYDKEKHIFLHDYEADTITKIATLPVENNVQTVDSR